MWTDMMKVKAIQEWKRPWLKSGRSLLGLANYYHNFIQDFSKVARILPDLLGKNGYPKSGMSFVTKPLGA